MQSPPTDRGGSRELPQWTDVGVVVRPRSPDHAHTEDRVPEVYVPPDSTADVERISTSVNMTPSDSVVTHGVNFYHHYKIKCQDPGPVVLHSSIMAIYRHWCLFARYISQFLGIIVLYVLSVVYTMSLYKGYCWLDY